ncbi:MAG: ImmA/IrrE family metallo-endopeptidase [Patescibacteria group bacterium]
MQNLSKKNYGWKSNQEWHLKKINGIPACYLYFYTVFLNKILKNFKEIINDIIVNNGSNFSLPMEFKLLEDYLSGYKIEYIGFSSPVSGIDGYWEFDDKTENRILVYYNMDSSPERQRFTKAHELFHIVQFLDPEIRNLLDFVKYKTILPAEIIQKLIEKSADKGAAMFLMPNNFVIKKYKEAKSVDEMATIFRVSKQAMSWRLEECKLSY